MRLDNDGSDHPGQDILDTLSDYGPYKMRRSHNLSDRHRRPLPGISQTLFPAPGPLRLQQVCLGSFWQRDQHDCRENTLDLVLVEVTEVG